MRAVLCIAALALAGCGDDRARASATRGTALPWDADPVPAAPEPDDNPGTPAKIDLGRLLFYDPILSSDRQVACATCHSEDWGMGDGLARSVGVDGTGPTGPGRTGPNITARNALTLWNTAYRARIFWDGRAATLEDQVLGPLHARRELDRDPAAVVADLAGIPGYASRFADAFPGDSPAVSVENMVRAIAAFERSLVTDRAPYDHYAGGDLGSLDATAQRGMFLFAEVGCAGCHVPPLFASERYEDRAVAPVRGIDDQGRAEATHDPEDRGKFRVPTLRNVRETGPYFHTGAVVALEDAVRHEAGLVPGGLADDEIAAITTFLDKGLIDPSRSPARPETVPSGLPVPKDGFRIPR